MLEFDVFNKAELSRRPQDDAQPGRCSFFGSKYSISPDFLGDSPWCDFLEFRNKIQSRRTRQRLGSHSGANGRSRRIATAAMLPRKV
jgi:hypothetical protein